MCYIRMAGVLLMQAANIQAYTRSVIKEEEKKDTRIMNAFEYFQALR